MLILFSIDVARAVGAMSIGEAISMRLLLVRSFFALACSGSALVACTADVHDNQLTVENPKVAISTTADVNNVHAGSSIPVNIEAKDVFPVAPDQTPPPEHVNDAVFFKIFLDDADAQELVVTASVSVNVTIPASTPPGSHKLICKTFSHDGEDTGSDSTIDITVTATATVSTPPPVST
jgi:hypothetical protein